jgi:hypothetical protein
MTHLALIPPEFAGRFAKLAWQVLIDSPAGGNI